MLGKYNTKLDPKNNFQDKHFETPQKHLPAKEHQISSRDPSTGNPAGNYTLNALILHEQEIELYTSSGKLLIKA